MASVPTRLFIIPFVLFYNNQDAYSELNGHNVNVTNKNCQDIFGTECVFPFTYKGIKYNNCILEINSNDSGWCSTKVDKDRNSLPGHTTLCTCCVHCVSEKPEQASNWDTLLILFLAGFVAFQLILIAGCWIKRYNKYNKNKRLRREVPKNTEVDLPLKPSLKKPIPSISNENRHRRTLSRQTSRVEFDPSVSTVSLEEETGNRTSIRSFISTDSYVHSITGDIFASEVEEATILRKKVFQRQMSGNSDLISYTLSLNEQVHLLPYNAKYEIKRDFFSIKEMLGSGNFGYVFLGEAISLFYPNSTTVVAIKTINDAADLDSVRSLLCEIKIMSQLELNLNLVNMVACCTSQFVKTGEMWLLMEYCQLGDMKSFLIQHRSELLNSLLRQNSRGSWTATEKFIEPFDSRILVQFAYDIASGMKYLARKQIMHGDLSARNILISAGENGLVAKAADFGLSKNFYDDIAYKKSKRKYVPWKWMAMEYLDDACFNIKSDVWSYGVVMWELFSLGKEPYAGKTYETVLKMLKTGYRLPCPEEIQKIHTWSRSPLKVYKKITKKCFVVDPKERSTFSKIVDIIKNELTEEEKGRNETLSGRYHAMGKMRKGSIAAIKQEIMTQTSLEENEALLRQFLGNREKGNNLSDVADETKNINRPVYRRLTSVF